MVKKSIDLEEGLINKTYDPEPYFALLDLYFEKDKQVLVRHHIDSFNQFIEEIIPSIVKNSENIIFEKITADKIYKYRLVYTDLGIYPPLLENDEGLMYPLDAIQKRLSYSAKYTATVTQYQDIIDIDTEKRVTNIIGTPEKDMVIAKIPIMVGSKYCNLTLKPDPTRKHCRYDPGGGFIVNGSEKVVMSVETMIHRKPLVFTQKDQNYIIYYVKVHSRPATQFVGNVQVLSIRIKKDNTIILAIPQFKEVSIFTFMRALGLESDEEIVNAILHKDKEKNMMNQLAIFMNSQGSPPLSKEEAIEKLVVELRSTKTYSDTSPEIKAQQKKKYLMKVLTQYILPHVTSGTGNVEVDMIRKAKYIGYMIHKLLKCYLKGGKDVDDYRGCDDRDSMTNKRIELPGVMLGTLFEQYFKKSQNDANRAFKSKYVNDITPPSVVSLIKANSIEQGLRQALSTGAFGSKSRKGLSQMLNRMNHLHSLSYQRRIITPTVDASTNKMTSPRHLHNSQYGSMCPFETPEGPKTGIVKNMAITAGITINMNDQIPIIEKFLEGKIITLEFVDPIQYHKYIKIFLNGNMLGISQRAITIHEDLRKMRFNGEIELSVSLVMNYSDREFHIYTEGGRLIRPYLTVTNNKLNFKPEMLNNVSSWDEFIYKYPGVIEYIDKEEEQGIMLAAFPKYIEDAAKIMNKPPLKKVTDIEELNRTNRYDGNVFDRYTHMEIHPCTILGVISSNIPFADHNQSPRGIFQYNQARQAMGLYISDYRERTDISYILYHPQIPIVTSRASKYTGSHIFPSGENAIVAIASYTGYNQEDSLLMNNSAIEKGLFRAQALKKQHEQIKKNPASSQTGIFMKPDRNKVDGMKDANYDKLSEEGYAKVETVVKDGDVIIGMVNPKATNSEEDKPFKDSSTQYKSLVPGAIDKIITGVNNDGYPIILMRIRSERIPAVGDKFACYDKWTQVLTARGWIFFKDLNRNDRVGTLSRDGLTLVYEVPTDIQRYQYKGKMMLVNGDNVSLCVTPNHRMWVSDDGYHFNFQRADEIRGKERYFQTNVANVRRASFPQTCVTDPHAHAHMLHEIPSIVRQYILTLCDNCDEIVCFGSDKVDMLQQIVLHAGWSSTYDATSHKLKINKKFVNSLCKVEWADYDDSVYCCTVSSDIICVRRNGLISFSGNSRSGQKGTVGYKPKRSDLPFTLSGLVPDIIINPNCIPKRMTIGQLIECLQGKVCAIKGVFGDATPFTGVDIDGLNAELVAAGLDEYCNETMYNGMNGRKMKNKIFIGPTYYQRLKQMVGDKVHSRARGATQLLTRQPPEGRTRDGGLRAGEMERDAMCAHGIAQFVKERTLDNSDIYTCYVCDICGLFAHKVPHKKHYMCHSCNNTTKISKIVIPYAFKLFMQELRSINILGRIRTSKSIVPNK